MSLSDLDLLPVLVAFIVVFVAGVIRGYSGFGFAMVAVTGLSLAFPPAVAVPVVLILEVLASLKLIPKVRRDVDWRSLRWLLAGAFPATPVGVYLLATVPARPLQLAISLIVIIAAILLLYGWVWKKMPGTPLIFGTGLACGLLNGAAAIGGPPVILFYTATPAGVAVSRASIIAFFLGIDLMSLASAAATGLVNGTIGVMAALCSLPLYLGISIGNTMFDAADKTRFRRHVLVLLLILSSAIVLKVVWTDVLPRL